MCICIYFVFTYLYYLLGFTRSIVIQRSNEPEKKKTNGIPNPSKKSSSSFGDLCICASVLLCLWMQATNQTPKPSYGLNKYNK